MKIVFKLDRNEYSKVGPLLGRTVELTIHRVGFFKYRGSLVTTVGESTSGAAVTGHSVMSVKRQLGYDGPGWLVRLVERDTPLVGEGS